jgi:catabolite regulation protein CreA
MGGQRCGWMLFVVLLGSAVGRLHAEDIGCVSTTFRILGANDKICVSAFDDPKVPGVTCHLSHAHQAKTPVMALLPAVRVDRCWDAFSVDLSDTPPRGSA